MSVVVNDYSYWTRRWILDFDKAQESISDITSTLRSSILNRAKESVTGTLENTMRVLKMKSKNTLLSRYISAWNDTETWRSTPEILSYHYNFAAETEALENTGLLFRADASGNQSYMAAYPKWGQIYYQDVSTRYILTGSPVNGQNEDYSLTLDSSTSVIRNDWMPDSRFPELKTDGIQLWTGRSLGNVGEGGYTAAHFAMLSIKSLDDFLKTVEVSKNGAVSIIEGSTGLMLASSLSGVAQNGTENSRFSAVNNPNALISASATFVANLYGTNGTIQSIPSTSAQTFATSFKALDDDILVNGYWIRDDSSGMKWLVLLTIPSNDFLAVIRSTFRNAILSVAGFCCASLILSGLLSYLIASPLSKLAKSMVQATQFDFSELRDGYLERRSCVTEIGRLEGVFHELMLKFANAIKANKALITARGENVNGLSTTSGGISQTASHMGDLMKPNNSLVHNSVGRAQPQKPYAPWE
ncbi:hypothetical protein BC829DRAFT_439657 [Chytridium lagenaria]|nr:hypothetical protein BC829DRAFT_439657 [Chytridium lagenaria]